MDSQINKWGNSAAVRIPAGILSQTGLAVNSTIRIEAKDGRIIIEPTGPRHKNLHLPFTEAALLAGLDAHTAHADEITALIDSEVGE